MMDGNKYRDEMSSWWADEWWDRNNPYKAMSISRALHNMRERKRRARFTGIKRDLIKFVVIGLICVIATILK